MKAKKLGVALGSGGVKGLAHLGFLKVLEENEIPVSYIAGTSMGSIVGGLYSCCVSLDEMIKTALKLRMRDIIDLDLLFIKRSGFIKGIKASEALKKFVGDATFEDCKIPFKCAAVNVITGTEEILETGLLWKAMIASSAIPGVFLPQEVNGSVMLDGGLLNRVPIDIVRDMGADIVVGVDVLGPLKECDVPTNIVDTLIRAFHILEWHISKDAYKRADIIVTMDQENVDEFKIKNVDLSIEYGRKAASEILPELKKLMHI